MFTVQLTSRFEEWLDDWDDRRAQVRIAARLRQAEAGNLDDWKSVGGEISEMRVNFGPGYRLHFNRRGNILIVRLAGGDKSSQAAETFGERSEYSNSWSGIDEHGEDQGQADPV